MCVCVACEDDRDYLCVYIYVYVHVISFEKWIKGQIHCGFNTECLLGT